MTTKLKRLVVDRVDLVDRGANPGAHISLWKRDDDADEYWKRTFTADQRREAADRGQAMSDGSFPIINAGDLANAVRAIGRASNPGAAKAHIIRRARALGRTDLLPDGWTTSKEARDAAPPEETHNDTRDGTIAASLRNVAATMRRVAKGEVSSAALARTADSLDRMANILDG